MSLNKTEFKTNIKALFEDLMQREDTSIDDLAEGLADHIETYIKSANIVYQNGLVADGRAVTGSFNGNLEQMKGIGIQLIDNADTGDLMDLKVLPMRNELGLISEGLVVGNILQQNKALILLGQPNDFKHDPTLGVGIEDVLLTDDLLEYRHRIREHFAKDDLKISRLDLYSLNNVKIEAYYE